MSSISVDLETLKQLRETLEQSQKECNALTDERDTLKAENTQLIEKVKDLKSHYVQLGARYTDLLEIKHELEKMIKILKDELNSWQPWQDPPTQ